MSSFFCAFQALTEARSDEGADLQTQRPPCDPPARAACPVADARTDTSAVAEDELASLDALFARYHQELIGFLTRQLASHDLAEDMCHDVYLRLRMTGEPPRNPRAWLYRIARNLIIDHHRHQSRAPVFEEMEDDDERLSATRLDPERCLARRQKLQVIQQALAEQPHHLRQSLLWYRLEGVTKREIGERLGVSERMAGRYVQQAQRHCADRLTAAGCFRGERADNRTRAGDIPGSSS